MSRKSSRRPADRVEAAAADHPIHDEHASIRALLDRLQAVRDPGAVLAEVRILLPVLRRHFDEEEMPGGLYETLRDEMQGNLHRLQALMAEHGEFLADLMKLEQQAQACVEGPVSDLLRAASLFAARLRTHEAREGDYLCEAFTTDTGASD